MRGQRRKLAAALQQRTPSCTAPLQHWTPSHERLWCVMPDIVHPLVPRSWEHTRSTQCPANIQPHTDRALLCLHWGLCLRLVSHCVSTGDEASEACDEHRRGRAS
eukprot:364510-Chlamydomonas_euryale.AAC.7